MTTRIVVIGGGFIGQLVQLAIPSVRVLDWRKTAPTNHLETRMGPQYLWEPIPGVPNISFPVTTLVDGQPPTLETIYAYKKKIGKEEDGGNWGLQFQPYMTGYEARLPVPVVEYNYHVLKVDLAEHQLMTKDGVIIEYDVLISTIPLPVFLKLCVIPPRVYRDWRFNAIYMKREDISIEIGKDSVPGPISSMMLNYLSHPDDPHYRRTVVEAGDVRMLFHESLQCLPEEERLTIKIPVGKIHPHPESEDVLRSLRVFDAYAFGRYATWRPDELAHESWHHIEQWCGEMTR